MGLAVIHPGLFSTVQDLGRLGFRAWGVPPGGAFDAGSAGLANALLGNEPGCAVVELTLTGGTYEARAPLALALAGAPMAATVRPADGPGAPLAVPVCFSMSAGDRLVFGGTGRGARAYLAVLGGWQTPALLGSRSSETPLKAGDVLPCAPGWTPVRHPDPEVDPFATVGAAPLRVIDGPDADRLGAGEWDVEKEYRVGPQSDRMGLRLDGPAWDVAAEPERLSAAVGVGAVQAAGGRPLVLGIACGTMGGYPHVAHVISADLGRLGQARPGDRVRFARVSLREARDLDRAVRAERARRLAGVAEAARDRPGSGGAGGLD